MTLFVYHFIPKPAVYQLAQHLNCGHYPERWPQWLQLLFATALDPLYIQALREEREQLKLTQMMKSAGYLDD